MERRYRLDVVRYISRQWFLLAAFKHNSLITSYISQQSQIGRLMLVIHQQLPLIALLFHLVLQARLFKSRHVRARKRGKYVFISSVHLSNAPSSKMVHFRTMVTTRH